MHAAVDRASAVGLEGVTVRELAFLADEAHAAGSDVSLESARDLSSSLNGIAMSANQEIQLLGDPEAGPRARRAMHAAVDAFA